MLLTLLTGAGCQSAGSSASLWGEWARRDGGLAYRVLWGVGAAVDAVVCGSGWFHARTHLNASLPGTVLREGRLLHAAFV